MRQQQFTRMGQSDMASHPIEQRCFILHLQFMNMLADGWLTDKQLFWSLRKAQIRGYAVKYFQTKIHKYITFYFTKLINVS